MVLIKNGQGMPPAGPGADSSTSELGLTASIGGNGAVSGQQPHIQIQQQQQQQHFGQQQFQHQQQPGGMAMVPVQMVPMGAPMQMMGAPQPGLLQNPGQQQQMAHSGSLSNMSTPNVSVGAGGTQYMAVPAGNFSGSGSTGLAPMIPVQAMPMGPGVMTSAHHGAPMIPVHSPPPALATPTQQQQQMSQSPNGNPGDTGPKQLIVNYIPTQVTEFELRSIFDQHGPVECARVIYDKNTGVSKGYGFVYYYSSAHAAIALKEMQGFELYGKPMRVGYAMPQRPLAALSPYSNSSSPVGNPASGNPSPTGAAGRPAGQ